MEKWTFERTYKSRAPGTYAAPDELISDCSIMNCVRTLGVTYSMLFASIVWPALIQLWLSIPSEKIQLNKPRCRKKMQRNKRLKWETCFETRLQWRLASRWTNGESKFNYWIRWWVTWLRIDAKAWSLSVDFVWNSGPKSKASIDAWYTDNSRSVDLSKGIYAWYIQATNIGFVVRACKNFVHMVSLSFKYPFKFSTSDSLKLLVDQHWKKNFSVRHNAQIRTSNSPKDVVTRRSVTECGR